MESQEELVEFSFPAGLIPELVYNARGNRLLRRHNLPCSNHPALGQSISLEEIQLAKNKPVQNLDKEETNRLLRAYYHDLYERLSRQFDKRNRQGEQMPVRPAPPKMSRAEVNVNEIAGDVGGEHVGLGAQVEMTSDLYSAYRQKKSGAYHSKIIGKGPR